MAKVLNVRLPDGIADRLEHLASVTHRPKSFYIKDLLERYLDDYESASLALERLNDKNAKYMMTEEVEKSLGLL
jgi:RHH-type transcriptional regulator, rel operon repressor / antitoxin RelB